MGFQGAGLTLINEGALPTTSWQNYDFLLNETSASNWRKFSNLSQNYSLGAPLATQAEMQAVLAGLTRFVIATDYTFASTDSNVPQVDRTYIDNVRLSTATTVPEPSSLVLLGTSACLISLLAARRRGLAWAFISPVGPGATVSLADPGVCHRLHEYLLPLGATGAGCPGPEALRMARIPAALHSPGLPVGQTRPSAAVECDLPAIRTDRNVCATRVHHTDEPAQSSVVSWSIWFNWFRHARANSV